jgi:esterase/lipase
MDRGTLRSEFEITKDKESSIINQIKIITMKEKIKLGYEVGTGKEVFIDPAHLIVTGVTQEAGKTTTLETLIKNSKSKAIVFRTKIGEKSFLHGTIIPPFFVDRSDWQFVQGLVESTIKEKLNSFDRSRIINICKKTGGNSLIKFKQKVDENLLKSKEGGIEHSMLTNLQAYLEIVLPKLQSITFSNKLELTDGLNIIDLERFSRDTEVQSLIIRSVADEVLQNFKDVVIVIPESWKFLPQARGNPCKLVIEEFIRQGAASGNYVWIDSQDIANVDKTYLKQISTWLLGYQSEINEVKHTIDQIPLPKTSKPKTDEIMQLKTGEFYYCTRDRVIKVYVQPFWLDDVRAKKIALGKLKVSEIDAPENLAPFQIALTKNEEGKEEKINFEETVKRFRKTISEMRADFFKKIEEMQDQINKLASELFTLKNKPSQVIDEDEIVERVRQKMPVITNSNTAIVPGVDVDEIVKQVLVRMPAGEGKVYEVAPLEKIKKDFLAEAKQKVLGEIGQLSERAKIVLKYLEARGVGLSTSEIAMKALLLNSGEGSNSKTTLGHVKELIDISVAKKNANNTTSGTLRNRIEFYLSTFAVSEQEIELVYNHILMEMLGK